MSGSEHRRAIAACVKGALLIATVATAAAPIAAHEASRRPEESATPAVARDPAQLLQQVLAAHNAARAAVRTPPLRWDPQLAADARRWASHLAATGSFEHSVEPRGRESEGENLWTGTLGSNSYSDMIADWVDERRYFHNNSTQDLDESGAQDVGSYAQVVWRSTTRIGCALASNASDDILVCRYATPGNLVGERAY